LNKDEIEARLKGIPQDKCVAFAVRSAMRVLPLLAISKKKSLTQALLGQESEAFWFWDSEDKIQYLLDVLRVFGFSIEYVLTKKYADYGDIVDAIHSYNVATSIVKAAADETASVLAAAETIAAAIAATTSAMDHLAVIPQYREKTYPFRFVATTADYDAFRVAKAAVNADFKAFTADTYKYAKPYAAFICPVDDHFILKEIEHDLSQLPNFSAIALLSLPLWFSPIPDVWQQRLDQFEKAIKTMNTGFDVWLKWYEERLQGKPIDVEILVQWNNIPEELKAQGVAKVNAHLRNIIQKKATEPLNQVRAIFIGHGEAGKTSLIRALYGEEVMKGLEPKTPGIEIRDWEVEGTEIQAHFWDFGGQVVFHSTHKFFLRSSCVYIIVINARSGINNSEQAEYWLDHVKVFGGSAPVLLVGNKADEVQIDLQMQTLKQKYPNIKGFYPLSCTEAKTTYKSQFDFFKKEFIKQLQSVGIHQMRFTKAHAKVLDELRQFSTEHAFLSENDFNQICDKHDISMDGELNRDWLVDIFDKLGVMLHFEELKTFHNAYMLNPRWLTHGVYTLMDAKQARLNDSDIVRILKTTEVEDENQHILTFPAEKCQFIIKVMQRFKLCYPFPNEANTLVIPALLPDELPSVNMENAINFPGQNEALCFEFDFSGFLPRNLIGEFMVSRNEEIKDNLQSQRGAVFACKSLQAQALVEADYHRRLLIMQVYGRDAKEYLTILYDSMLTVFGELNLNYREWVNLPWSARLEKETFGFNSEVEQASYQQLLALAKNKESTYTSDSGLKYDLNKVLGIILSKEGHEKAGITNNFYSGGHVLTQKSEIDMSNETTRTINTGVYVKGGVSESNIAGHDINIKTGKDAHIKPLLEQLLSEIKALNGKIPDLDYADMTEGVEKLISEGNRESPRKKWYEASLEGIKEAALTVGEIAKPVLEIAEKLSPFLLG
jgi:small GTP-binding protein